MSKSKSSRMLKLSRISVICLSFLVGCQPSKSNKAHIIGNEQFRMVGAICIEERVPVKRSRLKLTLNYQRPNRLYGQISTPWISHTACSFGQYDQVAWIVNERGRSFRGTSLDVLLKKEFANYVFPPIHKLVHWIVGEVSPQDLNPVYDEQGHLQALQYAHLQHVWKVRFLKYRKRGARQLPQRLQLICYDTGHSKITLILTLEIHLWTRDAIVLEPPKLSERATV